MTKSESWGGRRKGAGRPRRFMRVPYVDREHSTFFAVPVKLSPEIPTDPSDIVLAHNTDGRYGVYIEDDWYGATQALVILDYLEKHKEWLEQKAQENESKETPMKLSLSSWIGDELFKAVCAEFVDRGYVPPVPDVPGGTGAYAGNIVNQYVADLSEREVLAIIERAGGPYRQQIQGIKGEEE